MRIIYYLPQLFPIFYIFTNFFKPWCFHLMSSILFPEFIQIFLSSFHEHPIFKYFYEFCLRFEVCTILNNIFHILFENFSVVFIMRLPKKQIFLTIKAHLLTNADKCWQMLTNLLTKTCPGWLHARLLYR